MPDDDTDNVNNLTLIKQVEKLCKMGEYTLMQTAEIEEIMWGSDTYIEDKSFSTSHQMDAFSSDITADGVPVVAQARRYANNTNFSPNIITPGDCFGFLRQVVVRQVVCQVVMLVNITKK